MINAVDFLRKRFKSEGDSARAQHDQRYMKSTLKFHGVDAAQMKAAVRDLCAAQPLDHDQLIRAVEDLYATDWFDLRSSAVIMLDRRHQLIARGDAEWLITLVRRSACWAQVDHLATRIVPLALDVKPARQLKAWAKDDDFWVRRTSLLALLDALKNHDGDFALFTQLAVPMLPEKEFFIRKAIGWVLREVSKKRPALVRSFVDEHGEKMAGLTRREATKYLP